MQPNLLDATKFVHPTMISSEEQLSAFLKKGWTRLSLQLATIGIAARVPLKCSPQLSNGYKTGYDAIDKDGSTDTLRFSYWRFLLRRTWLTSCSRCRSTLATIYCRSGQPCVILFWHFTCLCNNFTGLLLSAIGVAQWRSYADPIQHNEHQVKPKHVD